ncbi:nucleotide disphospho-sugar-binding domain-containing protein [Actinomadura fibrosa]|uniref:Nucleotide disphospho-sugar-binding domain-containing protein n=1 Tax=Actinomadura fibrosa TaxID=111802 RepID=A0ABW2Y107_9ACTN|nr:nucleotide disphospho-sugar-binding domain-containing protein [Actinomadura fibrosa]
MRVLVTAVPHASHLNIVIPYAQALQNAGHEVCVGTAPGGEQIVTAAGLTVVTFGEPTPLSLRNWKEHGLLPDQEVREAFADALGLSPAERDYWDVFYQYYAFNARFFLQREPREDIDGLVAFGRAWQPDLVLWDAWFPLGGVVARACGAPHARLLIGPDYSGWAHEVFAGRGGPARATVGENPLVEALRPVADRYGLDVDDDLVLGGLALDPIPAERRLTAHAPVRPVRWITYNGGAVKPSWLHARPERPRVALTLGLSVRLWQRGGDPRLPKLIEALDDQDVEVVALCTGEQLARIPRLPGNVRPVDYVPLTELLPTCSAVIHHGSSGAFMSSVAAGVPQLVVHTGESIRMIFSGEGEDISVSNADRDADSWLTAGYVAERGAGEPLDHQTQSVAEIRSRISAVLHGSAYTKAAGELRREWRARPGPADVIPELEKLSGVDG